MKNKIFLLSSLLLVGSLSFSKDFNVSPDIIEEDIYVKNNIFKEISIGQTLEIDNRSGGDNIGESVIFMNEVVLSTENWDYKVAGGVVFSSDTDDLYKNGNARMELEAIRAFNNGYLGGRWRAEDDYNRFYLRSGYNKGMFSGWLDAQYWSFNDPSTEQDKIEIEVMPLNIDFGFIAVGYYLDYIKYSGRGTQYDDSNTALLEEVTYHQIRAYIPLYDEGKLSLDLEYRLGLHMNKDFNESTPYRVHKDFQNNILILNANYAMTDSLDLFGYYRYDINNYKEKDGDYSKLNDGKYYGEFFIGWEYSF